MALVRSGRAPALAALALLLLVTAAPADARRPRGTRRATAAAPKPTNRAVVGIIGGGISGVRAASVLQEAGLTDFLLLEQDSKLGGRMRNEEIAPGEVRAPRRRGMPSSGGSQRAGHTARGEAAARTPGTPRRCLRRHAPRPTAPAAAPHSSATVCRAGSQLGAGPHRQPDLGPGPGMQHQRLEAKLVIGRPPRCALRGPCSAAAACMQRAWHRRMRPACSMRAACRSLHAQWACARRLHGSCMWRNRLHGQLHAARARMRTCCSPLLQTHAPPAITPPPPRRDSVITFDEFGKPLAGERLACPCPASAPPAGSKPTAAARGRAAAPCLCSRRRRRPPAAALRRRPLPPSPSRRQPNPLAPV